MTPTERLQESKAVQERGDGVREVLANHWRWLRQHTGLEEDPYGIVEIGEDFKNLSNEDKVSLSRYLDSAEKLGLIP